MNMLSFRVSAAYTEVPRMRYKGSEHRRVYRTTYENKDFRHKLADQEIELIGVEAKIGKEEGLYYRMTFRTPNRKTYKMRIEKPNYLLVLPYSFVDSFREREKELVKT